MTQKPTDCLLFVDEQMAMLVIAWERSEPGGDVQSIPEINAAYSPKKLSDVLGLSVGQVKKMVNQAVMVGIIIDDGKISDTAQKAVSSIIAKKLQELKN